jgi:hypothetical protein
MMAAALVISVLAWRRKPMGRPLGATLAIAYVAYMAVVFVLV